MIRCLIVDDEEPAIELIRLHIAGLKDFEVGASLNNALDAFSYLQKNPVDLVFLDIQMPKMSGLDLLRSLKPVPKIILTTAYREYAADAFDMEVFDYLLKPVTQERFLKAVAKFIKYPNGQKEPIETAKISDGDYMFFKVGREQVKISLKDILYIEGMADYIKVCTNDRTYIASEKLGYMAEKLPVNSFVRIHKSFIISLDKITGFNTDRVLINGKQVPVGRVFKSAFFKALRQQ